MHTKKILPALISALVLSGVTAAHAAPPYKVSNGNNDGPGSLRDALASHASRILISPSVSQISVDDTLEYTGTAPLTIMGSGQVVRGQGDGDTLLAITQGADLAISRLDFSDAKAGGWQLLDGGGSGILLIVPPERKGVVKLELADVTVKNVGDHGVHVLDCDLVDCGAGGGGAGEGSPASVQVTLTGVTIDSVGNGSFDADGVRVDERSAGNIVFTAVDSVFTQVGADGVELDEGGEGDVVIEVTNSVFSDNGRYCLHVDIENPLDPLCVDDGELDLDDGFDVDEAGAGAITGRLTNLLVKDNLDEGLDFDEEDAGGIQLDLVNIRAYGNKDEAIKISEADEGDVNVRLASIVAVDNVDDGIQVEEESDGNLELVVTGSTVTDNAKKDLKVEQQEPGEGTLRVRGSQIGSISTDDGVNEI